MDTKKINERAIESLKKYFNDNKEISREDLQPMTKEEVTNIVDSEISRYKAKIDEWFEAKTAGLNEYAKQKLKERWGNLQSITSSGSRLEEVVKDIIFDFIHFIYLMFSIFF